MDFLFTSKQNQNIIIYSNASNYFWLFSLVTKIVEMTIVLAFRNDFDDFSKKRNLNWLMRESREPGLCLLGNFRKYLKIMLHLCITSGPTGLGSEQFPMIKVSNIKKCATLGYKHNLNRFNCRWFMKASVSLLALPCATIKISPYMVTGRNEVKHLKRLSRISVDLKARRRRFTEA